MSVVPPLLIVIVGPTAAGKTALSVRLAGRFKTEIISADSRQFYKEMETGTAKPSPGELKKAPHHFINSLSIHDEYNVGKYEKEALKCLEEVFKNHDKAILVGGSGLFINAVCHGMDTLPEGDASVREQYENMLKEKGIEALQLELKQKDFAYYEMVDRKNPRRLIRALEVIKLTGMLYSGLRSKKTAKRNFFIVKVGITMPKEELEARINQRVDDMIAAGWLNECKGLYPWRNLNALKTVGYTEMFDYLDGKCDWDKTVEQIKTNTWHYAKRQLTWFRKDKEIKWFSPGDYQQICNYITTFVPS